MGFCLAAFLIDIVFAVNNGGLESASPALRVDTRNLPHHVNANHSLSH